MHADSFAEPIDAASNMLIQPSFQSCLIWLWWNGMANVSNTEQLKDSYCWRLTQHGHSDNPGRASQGLLVFGF